MSVTHTVGKGIAEVYLDLPAFGNGAMWIDSDPNVGLRFSARPLREVYIEDDDMGKIDEHA